MHLIGEVQGVGITDKNILPNTCTSKEIEQDGSKAEAG